MTFWKWSKTAASNGSADSTCPFPEGMSPAALNDGARGMMAAAAKYRDDIAGASVTGGTSTAYTVSSNQVFDTLAHLDGAIIAFTPHATNGATVTLNVDGLGVKPLRSAPSVELPAGSLIQGTPYVALYNNTDGAWYLHGGVTSRYSAPVGGSMIWFDSTLPSSGLWAWANGQVIASANIVCPVLLARWGTRFGGNGVTTMGVPDLREVAPIGTAGMGATGGRGLISFTGWNVVGTVFGEQNHQLTQSELPVQPLTFTGTSATVTVSSTIGNVANYAGTNGLAAGGNAVPIPGNQGSLTSTGTFTPTGTITTFGGNAPHNNMQPSTTVNFIILLG